MTGCRRHWISYLTLTLVVVGAVSYGFLSQAAERMQAAGVAFAEGTTLTDRGTLPTLRGARQLTDARKSRTAQSGKADDGDTLPAMGAAKLHSAPPSTALRTDLGRCVAAAARTTHRPRGPPAFI
jgi:hypothetical protein